MPAPDLPAAPGTYMLILRLDAPARIIPGRLGPCELPAGLYAYVGSAHGPGGLRARLARHLRHDKLRHWHIDALTAAAYPVAIWATAAPDRLECTWARALAALPGVTLPVAGFGSSDCACPAHLFALPEGMLRAAWRALGQPDEIRYT
ncbi:MAG: GIY-YIG nuclease family protein [Chloroflexi bacterium]|nr:GIY-YIG nuclease family protein [Chloroflexota bacterium]